MNERQVKITADIIRNQRRAAAPETSVWVEANAGSGKTHVLTQRVLRLLLAGTAPENLLCLTYTKAAAAEMRRRVGDQLGAWATMSDGELAAALEKLEDGPPAPATLRRARTLFGHALETPGGLKINTIHAFCEAVLQRFPLEAGVPFGFTVIEDIEQADLVRQARDAVLAEGIEGSGPAADAVLTLYDQLSDSQIEEAIATALGAAGDLQAVLAHPQAAKRNLQTLLGLTDADTIAHLRAEVVTGTLLPPGEYKRVFDLCPPDPAKSRFEDKLARIDPHNVTAEALFEAFLKADGGVPAKFPKKILAEAPDGLGDTLLAEAERLSGLHQKLCAARLAARSDALLDVLGAIALRYCAKKRAASSLDFNDLIERMLALLGQSDARDWVRYKLDAAITHILVDESQDTNPAQWALIRTLVDEFFSGDGVARAPRTLFAVGDKKQSIYSFQGAVPAMFSELGREFGLRARQAGTDFDDVPLRTSFRTLPNILEAVDRVCRLAEIGPALLVEPPWDGHDSARADRGGRVELWPPIRQQEVQLPQGVWPLPGDIEPLKPAPRQMAEQIVQTVKDWIDTARPLQQRGRAVTADDVLILVQSRGPLFHEIIRALKSRGLPSPGADRLPVSSHIAVLDLLALGDVLLNPADDLGLAALLRAPLFAVTEEALMHLAAGRERGETLWRALQRAADPACRQAHERLQDWRSRLDFERPYNFFANVLFAEGGMRQFHERLGEEVDDVLAEFLDLALANEQSAQPSLQGFLAAMRKSDISIKREFGEKGGGVRVMTVHGAKGLESPIVILADAATAPDATKMRRPVYLEPGRPGPLLIHAPNRDSHTLETASWRDRDAANQRDEYWRKLYVAMTRAEDELYVTGALPKSKDGAGSWYEAIEMALAADAAPLELPGREMPGLVFPATPPPLKPVSAAPALAAAARRAFAAGPLPPPATAEIIQPSRAQTDEPVFQTAAETLVTAEQARREGLALHALLQHLPRAPAPRRYAVGLRALETLLPQLPGRHAALAQKAAGIISNPDFALLFGPDARAELPFIAEAWRGAAPVRIAGRIDRLIVTESAVMIVDFKSDAIPPETPHNVPPGYLAQMGLYAGTAKNLFAPRSVSAAIFWTAAERLMVLPAEALERATADITFQRPA